MIAKRHLYTGSKNEDDIKVVRIIEKCPSCGHCKIENGNGRIEWVMAHYLITMEAEQPVYKTKILRFTKASVPSVLSGEKDITWRVDDEKNVIGGDILSLRNRDDIEFAKAQVLWTKNSTFANLTEEDKKNHEPFASERDMLRTYSLYYHKKLTRDSQVKVIKFRLFGLEE